ncbi:MAG: DUF951 domain-containing protein [Eubacteriaceae bacterium]|nr:DUF951 domain-containing protein [Eubacteriaceae bacterium]
MINDYSVGDTARMKKPHPCGSSLWEIIRTGADIKIRCLGCSHIVMLPRNEFNKKLKSIIKKSADPVS